MRKAYPYRLYPTKKQERLLESSLETCRLLYNFSLAERKEAWETKQESITYKMQQNNLPELKAKNPRYRKVHSQVLQDVLNRLDKAFDAFFRRLKAGENPGYPRFKGKDRYHSLTYPQSGFNLDGDSKKLQLSKIGNIRVKIHRPVPDGAQIKTCTIKRRASGWYVIFSIDFPISIPKVETHTAVGIDVGIYSFVATSDGQLVDNPKHFRTSEKKLAKAQRRLSRRKKGSNRRKKARNLLAKHHEHVSNQRKDFHFKTANDLVAKYDLLIIENLQVKNMVRNHHLAKSISDAGWSQFFEILTYKAENAGKEVLAVNPSYTSQVCSNPGCNRIVPKILSVRIHRCECGLVLHRDINAAINILRLGISLRGGKEIVFPYETRNPLSPYLDGATEAPHFRAG